MFKTAFLLFAVSILFVSTFAYADKYVECALRCGVVKGDDLAQDRCVQRCLTNPPSNTSINNSAVDQDQGLANKGSTAPSGDAPGGAQAASGDTPAGVEAASGDTNGKSAK